MSWSLRPFRREEHRACPSARRLTRLFETCFILLMYVVDFIAVDRGDYRVRLRKFLRDLAQCYCLIAVSKDIGSPPRFAEWPAIACKQYVKQYNSGSVQNHD